MNVLSKQGESLKSFTYDNQKIRSEIYKAMNSTEFIGISVSCTVNWTEFEVGDKAY